MKTLIFLLTASLFTPHVNAAGAGRAFEDLKSVRDQWGAFDAPTAPEARPSPVGSSLAGSDSDAPVPTSLIGSDASLPAPKAVSGFSFPESYGSRDGGSLNGSTVEWARYQGTPIQGCMTPSERMAACGPIAAEALVRFLANNSQLNKICDIWSIAKGKGYWNGAMQGPDFAGERGLLRDLNIETELVWVSNIGSGERMVRESLDQGKPVIISTRRHYFFAAGYDNNGRLFVGNTGKIMSNYGGTERMTLSQISSAGNGSLALLLLK